LEKGGFRFDLLKSLPDLSELCVKSRPENFRDPLASSHKRARKKGRQVISAGGIKGPRLGGRLFANGHRLPSKQGFVNR
jgi:hypothetical protein